MEKTTIFADGMYFDRPQEGAPPFVKGRIKIEAAKFIPFLNAHANADGIVRLDLLTSKENKLYLKLDDYKPVVSPNDVPKPEDIPF
jgi:hypothetical protein